jgi:3-hydroxymyristoyl/3-hydroxydecanoyl-(acyl carrier protein) dehydratase/uncharacterized membrane protein
MIAYVALLLAAFLTKSALLDEMAAFALVSLLLLPALRGGRASAWAVWLTAAGALVWLARGGRGQLAIDALPILINAALCGLFARTLIAGREPLIARIIGVIEGPQRLALPGVARYARRLTWAWALLLGVQACALLVVAACSVPEGLFATFGVQPPITMASAWRWYLHLGSYALVIGFLVLEYAYRRWHLRHIPHAPLPLFIARLARRWPALLQSFAADLQRHGRPMNDRTITARICIAAQHPSLPGHFPGNPVIPGVVLLDRVAAALEQAGMRPLRRLLAVKFRAPLLPGQSAELTATLHDTRVRFRIDRDGTPILSGEGELQ